MVDEKPNKYEQNDFLPIPTYDEAISSRPSSSHSFLGSSEISHDAERQGLLGRNRELQRDDYQVPTVESARSSLDFLPSSGENSPRGSTEELRREITQMEVLEPGADADERGLLLRRNRLSKHITSLTHSLSSINLPFRQWLPSRDYLIAKIPTLLQDIRPNWILVGRFFALILVLFLAYLLFLSDIFTVNGRQGAAAMYYPDTGTKGSFILAEYVQNLFLESQLEDVGLEQFDVYLNYPTAGGRKVAIVEPQELRWEAKIEEKLAYPDEREQTFVFHGHSRSGTATGPLVYANYGSREDFKFLQDGGVNLNGSIALVRYYGSQGDRALKVKAAELAGAIGCIIYSDPAEDGFMKGDPYPTGRYMPSDGVQRGAVSLMSWIVGDVLSSGYASYPEEPRRESKENNAGLNKIPSIPLAWRDAQKLLQALKGHGVELDSGSGWIGGVPGVNQWWTGDASSPTILLQNEQEEVERRPIYNVLGRITGVEQPEKSIIVGNHRDAWCFGAADPGSGTAVLLEVIRVFGDLQKKGWRPLRTIEFASWDGEEYNLIGSTEHVEARMDNLRRNGVAYLNVDVAVTGNDFVASASPILQTALLRVLERVVDPMSNKTLRAVWAEKGSTVTGLGAGSDYVAFQDMAGTSSLDMGFTGAPYPYHSCYDNFNWMDKFGDPGFQYHKTLAQVWALLILELSDRELLTFDFEVYANAVKGYVDDLEAYARKNGAEKNSLDLTALHGAADEFTKNAMQFHAWDRSWEEEIGESRFESNVYAIKRISHNTRKMNFETNLLDINGGLVGREQFKHVLFAPQAWSGYDEAYIAGVRDAIDDGNLTLAQEQVEKVASILSYASRKLIH
ncbi:N-acetylated-alpha-linked acidic dipeptidase, partial [Lecanoromycetidae sp. Uapishka_2]